MSKPFPRVGRCIYCGTTEDLNDEHLVPYGLKGNIVLPDASCRACGDITGALEGHVQGKAFSRFRASMGFRSRKRKPQKEIVQLDVEFSRGGMGKISLPATEIPPCLDLPRFQIARAFRGIAEDDPSDPFLIDWWKYREPLAEQRFAAKYDIRDWQVGIIDLTLLARMIAKIGYVTAVATFGLDTFQPLIIDFILGRSQSLNYLVGTGPLGEMDEMDSGGEWHVSRTSRHNSSGMIVSLVQLFAGMGAPTYHVLVGLAPGGKITQLYQRAPHR